MWPIQLAFRKLVSCRIFLCSLTLSNTSSFLTCSVQLIFPILLQDISKLSSFVHKIFCLHLHHTHLSFETPDIHPRTPMSSSKHQYIYFDVINWCNTMSFVFLVPKTVFSIMSLIRQLGSSPEYSPGNFTFFPQVNWNCWSRDCLRQLQEDRSADRDWQGRSEKLKRKTTSWFLSTGKCCKT
jgi:hypothetical protein